MTRPAVLALALTVSMLLASLAHSGTIIVAPAGINVATPCGDELIAGASKDRNVFVWSAAAGTLQARLPLASRSPRLRAH